ncbi:MAG: zinc ribbon domain-containing protein [Fervidicoccaceae archaeon]
MTRLSPRLFALFLIFLIASIYPQLPMISPEAQRGYPYPPVVGDSWVYTVGDVGEDGSFTETGTLSINITSRAGGDLYILRETSEGFIGESYSEYTISGNWSIINQSIPLYSTNIEYRPPAPYIYHPRSSSDSFAINTSITLYTETPNGTMVMRGIQSISYSVVNTTWIVFKGVKIQAYVVHENIRITVSNPEYNVTSESITDGYYIINNSFKLYFVAQFTTETTYPDGSQYSSTTKAILQSYSLTPDPLATTQTTTAQETRTSPTTTTRITTTTTAEATTTRTTRTTETTTTPIQTTTQAGYGQAYTLLISIARMGNYSGPDIPLRIRIQNLATGETIASVEVSKTYSLRLPPSTYVISIEDLSGGGGGAYYRFLEWRISVDGSSRSSQDPSIQIRLDRDTVITAVFEFYTLQQGVGGSQQVTQTQTQRTTTATTAVITNTTAMRTAAQPPVPQQTTRPPAIGGGETGASLPPMESPQQPWYSSPLVIGSIAGGGAAALAAFIVLRRRASGKPLGGGYHGGGSEYMQTRPEQATAPQTPQAMQQTAITAQPAQPGQPVAGYKICQRCGTQNPEQARFCRRCGERLPDIPASPAQPVQGGKVCPRCGATARQEARFCPRCGSQL